MPYTTGNTAFVWTYETLRRAQDIVIEFNALTGFDPSTNAVENGAVQPEQVSF